MAEDEVGVVTHYFGHLGVAAIKITEGELSVGDTIHLRGHTTDMTTTIDSMQLEHEKVDKATVGDTVGIKVPDKVREHDQVFLLHE